MQITGNISVARYAQHVVCHVIRRDSSAIMFDKIKIAFMSAAFLFAERVKEGRKLECREKTPDHKLQKMSHTKARKFKPSAN